MEISELISGIIKVCGPDKPRSLKERIKCALGEERGNPFAISKSGHPMEIRTREEFDKYMKKLLDTGEMTAFVQQSENTEFMVIYLKLINNLVDDIGKKIVLEYRAEKDNTQIIAETIQSVILIKIKKIISSIYRKIECRGEDGKREDNDREALLRMTEVLNGYLSGLGVYTVIAEKGDAYSGVIMDRYEPIANGGKYIHKIPRVISVEYPAYVIDYMDENGDMQTLWENGKCICE